ncbi:MAG: type VI secretion system baseplate subunit TssK [Gemmatimonadota bacterium]
MIDVNDLRSVNWTTGMLLAPRHFHRQDRFVEAAFGWLVRHCVPGTGLLGGGVRVDASERGLARHDPRVEVSDDGTTLSITVTQARGITPDGRSVEVAPEAPLRARFDKAGLGGQDVVLIHVLATGDREEDDASVGADPANPLQAALLRPRYEVRLGVEADARAGAIVVGRCRRASETLQFELDGEFIPPCVTVAAHSQLFAGWKRLRLGILDLAGRYAELHRVVAHWIQNVGQRGEDVRGDREILAFLERAALGLDTCAYETMDPNVAPERFFQQVDRAGRRAALALDLSPETQLFLRTLTGADARYGALLEDEARSLSASRDIGRLDDLGQALTEAEATLTRLRRLQEALEGRYVDYRMNRSVGALRFLLDHGGEHFYTALATPARAQRDGDVLTYVFSDMSLNGRHEYRLVLMGDADSGLTRQVGETLVVTLRINPVGGKSRPITQTVVCEVPGQRNFAVNFTPPAGVASVEGLHVTVEPGAGFRGAQLYQRRLGLPTAESPVAPVPAPSTAEPRMVAPAEPAPPTRIRIRAPQRPPEV